MKFDEFVNESINEGAVKQFEMGVSSLVRNVKTGYGWIDPSYVYDTFNQADDFEGINWDDVKDEIYQRLIDNNLLYYSSDTDPEQQGKKVTSVKQIQESVNESALEIAGGIILGILGLKTIAAIFKQVLGRAQLKSVKDPVKLKALASKLATEAMAEGGKNPLQCALWNNTVNTMIEKGDIKNAYELAKTFTAMDKIDIKDYFESEGFDLEGDDESINEAARVPSNVLEFAKRKGSYATALVKKAAGWAEKAGKYISNGTAIGKNYSTIILDMKHHGSEIYINLDNETIELFGEEVTDAKSFAKVLATNESVEVNEGSKDEQVKKECISRLSDFFRVTPNSLSKFNFDGKDNIKELTRALNSTSDKGTELYYQTAIKSVKRDLGVNESEVNEDGDAGKFVTGTLNTPFDTLKIGDLIKLDALDYTRRGDDEKITCILPDGNKAEVLKKHITVKL